MSTVIESAETVTEESQDIRQRRLRAVRTAWLLGLLASLIFAAFILSGVLNN